MKRLAKKVVELCLCFSLSSVVVFAQRGGGGMRGGGGGFGHGGFRGSIGGGFGRGGFGGFGGLGHSGFGGFGRGFANRGFHNGVTFGNGFGFGRFGHRGFGFGNFNRFGFGFGYPGYWGYPYGYYGFPYYGYWGGGYPGYYEGLYPYGYSSSPNVIVVAPYAEATPPVVINQEVVRPARPVIHEYHWNSKGEQTGQTIYLLAFRNEMIHPAKAYWVQGNTLHWVDLNGVEKQAKLSTLDRPLSAELNRDRNVQFRLPPQPAVNH